VAKNVLTDTFSESLNGAATARIEIDAGDGNLTIDRLGGGEQALATGALQYMENSDKPNRTFVTSNGRAALTLRSRNGGRRWFHVPWAACNGATDWHIYVNPGVPSDITAHSDGGNVKLNLAGMSVTRVSADTGGGNMDVVVPGSAANLSVTAKTGAGNVTVEVASGITGKNSVDAGSGAGNVVVRIPAGLAARVHAAAGLGGVTIDSRLSRTSPGTYQSPGFEGAADKVEITAKSGAGTVTVTST
jgi:hypothetical protein